MSSPASDRQANRLLIPIAAVALGLYLLLVETTGYRFPCLFHSATGLNCPGCGSQRALHALIHGHPLEAWSYNLLLPVILIYILLLLLLPNSRLYLKLTSVKASWSILAIIILWWILRNILNI